MSGLRPEPVAGEAANLGKERRVLILCCWGRMVRKHGTDGQGLLSLQCAQ